jgi:addiction module HigA family antidote
MNSLRDPRRRPTHPGAILREDILPALKISAVEFAERVGISPQVFSDLLLEKVALSSEIAQLLAKFLKTTPESWLLMQTDVDNWEG